MPSCSRYLAIVLLLIVIFSLPRVKCISESEKGLNLSSFLIMVPILSKIVLLELLFTLFKKKYFKSKIP